MPSLANIVINDGETTPVAHTFKPRTVDNGKAVFKEDASIPLEQNQLVVQLTEPAKAGVPYKGRVSLMLPHVVTDSSGKKVVSYYEAYAVEANTTESTTLQQAKNARVLLANALLNASVAAVLDGREPFYGA